MPPSGTVSALQTRVNIQKISPVSKEIEAMMARLGGAEKPDDAEGAPRATGQWARNL
jgi:hypothetical protein